METVIKRRLSELTVASLEQIKDILRRSSKTADPELAILVNTALEAREEYVRKLNESIEQYKRGETVPFTMEELTDYVNASFKS